MTKNAQVLVLDTLDVKNLVEFKGFEKSQIELLNDNPLFDVVDTKTYEAAKKSRTTLRSARTSLEGQEKTIVKKITSFRKDVGAATGSLIGITKSREDEFQNKIKDWENKKADEKKEREEAAAKREAEIKESIDLIFNSLGAFIGNMTFNSIEEIKDKIASEIDAVDTTIFAEFEELFDDQKIGLNIKFNDKKNSLTIIENQRLAQIEIDKETKRLADEKKAQIETQKKIDDAQKEIDIYRKELEAEKRKIEAEKAEIINRKAKELEDAKKLEEENKAKEIKDIEVKDEFILPTDLDKIEKKPKISADKVKLFSYLSSMEFTSIKGKLKSKESGSFLSESINRFMILQNELIEELKESKI